MIDAPHRQRRQGLFGHALRYRPTDTRWEGRDRFLLSIGHYAIALYAALIEAGVLPEEELETYGTDDSRMVLPTPGLPYSKQRILGCTPRAASSSV